MSTATLMGTSQIGLGGIVLHFADSDYRSGYYRQLEIDYNYYADDGLGLLLTREATALV